MDRRARLGGAWPQLRKNGFLFQCGCRRGKLFEQNRLFPGRICTRINAKGHFSAIAAVQKGLCKRMADRPSLFHGFRSISWRARHDSTGFPCPSSQLVDLKPRYLSRRSMRSTYGNENPVKTFPLVPQLDLRANQSAIRRPQVAKQKGENGATQKETARRNDRSEARRADLGVFEGAQPLHQAPWGAAAKQQGENGATEKRRPNSAASFLVAPGGLEPTTHGL